MILALFFKALLWWLHGSFVLLLMGNSRISVSGMGSGFCEWRWENSYDMCDLVVDFFFLIVKCEYIHVFFVVCRLQQPCV